MSSTSYDDKIVGSSANCSAVFGRNTEDPSLLSSALIKQARKSGQLNLSNRNISAIPVRLWKINEPDKEEQQRMKKGLSIDRVSFKIHQSSQSHRNRQSHQGFFKGYF